MPLYEFESVENPEEKESFFFSMKDCPKIGYIHTDEDGKEWKRIFSVPYASIDTKIDPNKPNDFVEKTKNMKGTFGDLLDKSAELSEKRAKERGGKDPIKEKFYDDYKKKRHGKEHLQRKLESKTVKNGFEISYEK